MPINTFRDIKAWQRAFELAKLVYRYADRLPDCEKYALASQIRRAVTSVYGNIAEGFGAGTRPRFLDHLRIARGSLAEVDGYLQFASEHHNQSAQLQAILIESRMVLQGLISSLESSKRPGPRKAATGSLITHH